MSRNGIISVQSISKFIRKLFTILLRNRSPQSLNSHSVNRIDTNERMRITKMGQDNMVEFVRIVPDQCLIELSETRYCCG